MNRRAHLAIACDTDPDAHPRVERSLAGTAHDNWCGITTGVTALRRRLETSTYAGRHGQPPITWLLRADRQIREVYGHAAFCFQAFERIWDAERRVGSEIGWHPHLYRWDSLTSSWKPYLGADDDLEELERCLAASRQCANIRAVRTGWCYHSNRLMRFFTDAGLEVDASAIPGSVVRNGWYHDWSGTPRTPFHPSKDDYRVGPQEDTGEGGLPIRELPVLVRRLGGLAHGARHGIALSRALRMNPDRRPAWKDSRWQGVTITQHRAAFVEALRQTLEDAAGDRDVFIGTYFHTKELLVPEHVETFVSNLEAVTDVIHRAEMDFTATTLTDAGRLWSALRERAQVS